MWEAPVKFQCTSVVLGVHARSVVACGLDGQTAEVFERRLTPDHAEILEWIRSLSGMLDGDPGLDRAMGPMQFIPET